MSLSVRITPNARASMISGWGADEKGRPVLLIRLAAPPVDGQANAELIRFLAEVLACPKSDIRLTRGSTSRQKALLVPESARETLRIP